MSNYAILPCNGLDKCAGCISREVALMLSEKIEAEILCPVFYRISETKYNNILEEYSLLVIDGCNTKCATKLANEKNLEIKDRINVSEEAKNHNIQIHKELSLGENENKLVELIVDKFIQDINKQNNENSNDLTLNEFEEKFNYETYKKDKFIFKLAINEKLYFNENDSWAFVDGDIATIGVTDYVQHSLGDIMFFEPAKLDEDIEQFGELGCLESSKATFEIVSPVSGKIIAVNNNLEDLPEYVNENPYEKGWLVKIKLSDFEEDKELLIKDKEYIEVLIRKVENFHV
ncbi:glycine cleavage system protein GcvH [Romboutsia sp.]|uniref:glycine cleavage system protein GcvH n=1 Tax=Romboutsia sp. TaxID=1965302 RepID=UPI003F3DBC5F